MSNPRKKQILTLANEFARQAFFFLLWSFFAIAKNRITHLFAGCTRFARALRGGQYLCMATDLSC